MQLVIGYQHGTPRMIINQIKIFGRAPPLFWPKSTISRFGDRFRYSQYSLASLVCCSSAQGAPCPMESTPLFVAMLCVAVISH